MIDLRNKDPSDSQARGFLIPVLLVYSQTFRSSNYYLSIINKGAVAFWSRHPKPLKSQRRLRIISRLFNADSAEGSRSCLPSLYKDSVRRISQLYGHWHSGERIPYFDNGILKIYKQVVLYNVASTVAVMEFRV